MHPACGDRNAFLTYVGQRMSNLKTYFRVLFKNKTLSLINLLGLSVGISSCLFISMFLLDELGYDASQPKVDRIFRISMKIVSEGSVDQAAISSRMLAATVKQNFPEVEDAVRFGDMGSEVTIKQGEDLYKEKNVYKVDGNVFKIFSYPLLSGNPENALAAPYRVVLTKSIATKYFNHEDPIGKTISIGKAEYVITGVMEDVPLNSDLRFSMLASMDSTDQKEDWFDFAYLNYILFQEMTSLTPEFISAFDKKLDTILDDKINRLLREHKQSTILNHRLQPLEGLHFEPPLLYDTPKGSKNYIYIFSCVAMLILFIGCLNYINFSIVQSLERSKEVGIRKVVGASFSQLAYRYIGESFLFTLFALMAAVVITILMLPFFNEVTSRDFHTMDLLDVRITMIMVSLLVVVGLLAGSYPAFYTSSIRPVLALKGKVITVKGQVIRKISIAAQFFISIGLMSCTLIVYNQMRFIKNYDLGFRKDNIIVFATPSDTTLHASIERLKQNLLRIPVVKSVSLAGPGTVPGESPQLGTVELKSNGEREVRLVNNTYVDEDFLPSLNIKLAEGRNFDGRLNDFHNSALVNEALVKMMGWKNPLEHKLYNRKGQLVNIIGVVRDFHYLSLYNVVGPQVFQYHEKEIANLFVVLEGSSLSDQFSRIHEEWKKVFPNEPFVYKFLDETVNAQYEKEEKAMKVFTYFSVLTISISCLGLFGLSSLSVYQRKREIGIRKIVGADFLSITMLFAKEYIRLILLAIIVVSPLSWHMMNQWLETFPFRDRIHISIFMVIGLAVMLIALFTITFSISKISKSKPVNLIGEP